MDVKRFFFLSLDAALIGDIAWQVASEGHDVKYYIEAETDREIADGFVSKTTAWEEDLEWADVIVFDDIWMGDAVGTGELTSELRNEGRLVVGGTPNTDQLEDDRGYAMEILTADGISVLPHREFTDFDAGIRFVRDNPGAYVIKPLGEVQNVNRLLYVGRESDGSDVIDVLGAYKKAWGHRMKGFQLQRRVAGVEIAICGFFNGETFLEPINFNFEHKRNCFPERSDHRRGRWGRRCSEPGGIGCFDTRSVVSKSGSPPRGT